nr:unnamed protein product [Callosobruchus analis]
MVSQMESTCWL